MIRRIITISIVLLLTAWTMSRILANLDTPPARWDERTNMRVVQETRTRNSFPVLYYENKPFFEKPPLWYYFNLPFNTGETNIRSLRILSIASALLIVALSVIFVWKQSGFAAGVITWVMLLLSHQLFIKNQGGIFSTHTLTSADSDSLQILFILIAFIAGVSKKRSAHVICGVATGLAVLAKGPLGLVPLVVLIFMGEKMRNAFIIAVSIIAPWYIFMAAVFGWDFLETHLVYHQINRAVLPLEGHQRSLWYFITLLCNPYIYPAFPLALSAIILLYEKRAVPFVIRYCGFVAVLFFAIPSLAATKLAWYILPLYPFLAMFAGMVFSFICLAPVESHRRQANVNLRDVVRSFKIKR